MTPAQPEPFDRPPTPGFPLGIYPEDSYTSHAELALTAGQLEDRLGQRIARQGFLEDQLPDSHIIFLDPLEGDLWMVYGWRQGENGLEPFRAQAEILPEEKYFSLKFFTPLADDPAWTAIQACATLLSAWSTDYRDFLEALGAPQAKVTWEKGWNDTDLPYRQAEDVLLRHMTPQLLQSSFAKLLDNRDGLLSFCDSAGDSPWAVDQIVPLSEDVWLAHLIRYSGGRDWQHEWLAKVSLKEGLDGLRVDAWESDAQPMTLQLWNREPAPAPSEGDGYSVPRDFYSPQRSKLDERTLTGQTRLRARIAELLARQLPEGSVVQTVDLSEDSPLLALCSRPGENGIPVPFLVEITLGDAPADGMGPVLESVTYPPADPVWQALQSYALLLPAWGYGMEPVLTGLGFPDPEIQWDGDAGSAPDLPFDQVYAAALTLMSPELFAHRFGNSLQKLPDGPGTALMGPNGQPGLYFLTEVRQLEDGSYLAHAIGYSTDGGFREEFLVRAAVEEQDEGRFRVTNWQVCGDPMLLQLWNASAAREQVLFPEADEPGLCAYPLRDF